MQPGRQHSANAMQLSALAAVTTDEFMTIHLSVTKLCSFGTIPTTIILNPPQSTPIKAK